MKKLVSCLLIAATAASALAFAPVNQNSDNVKAATAPKTYIPRKIVWYNSKGAVYVKDIKSEDKRGLFYKAKDGKEKVLAKFDTDYTTRPMFYLRGDTVYYVVEGEPYEDNLYSVKTDGSSKTLIAKNVTLLGGYGSRVIFYYNSYTEKGYYCLNSKGQIKRIWKHNVHTSDTYSTLFNGKIFNGSHIYDIATKTDKKQNIKKSTGFFYDGGISNRNYLFSYKYADYSYVKRADTTGNIKEMKEIESIIGINESKTIIYSDKDNNVYRKTGDKKAVKLFTHKQLAKLFGDKVDYNNLYASDACIRGDKAYFCAYYVEDEEKANTTKYIIFQTGKNGGDFKILKSMSKQSVQNVYDLEIYENTLFIGKDFIADNGGFEMEYTSMSVK